MNNECPAQNNVSHFAELCLHPWKDHNDRNHCPQQQEEGERQPCDGGVIGRGTAATQEAWSRATQTRGLLERRKMTLMLPDM